jgi:hypothetical protein
MCWSAEASTILAVAGLGVTAHAAYKREPNVLWLALGYFSLMELLQAFTYTVIDDCGNPTNQIATLLGYLHITFQVFFINALSMYFIPTEVRLKIQKYVYFVCFIATISMLLQLYPFEWAGSCAAGRPLCGEQLCSVSGNWHIAWEVPTNGIGNSLLNSNNLLIQTIFHTGFVGYIVAGFILPLLYGSWKFTIYHLMLGPILASLTTNNVNEIPAIWCLLSIGILLIVIKTPLRDLMHVKHWLLWSKK